MKDDVLTWGGPTEMLQPRSNLSSDR